jgi:tetratricopeptide (TPR) repeat protein
VDAALNIAQLSQDMDIITRSLTNVSSYYLAAGDLARGVELLQQQVEISRRQGHIPGEANGLTNLGYHYLSLGLFEEGQSVLQEAIALSEQAGARRAAAYCKLNLGLACWRLGQLERAGAVLEDAQQDFTIINDAAALAFGKGYQGLVFEQAGKPEQAKATYTQALEAFSRYGLNAQAAEAQAGLARVALGEQDLPQAVAHAARVLPFLENKHGQGMELPFLAYLTCVEVYQKTGDNATAGRLLQDCTAELLERAERISHSDWRRSFLECIPEHRRILTLSDHAEENNHGTTRRKPDSGN